MAAKVTTRNVGFSSGHVSNVEGGHVTPSPEFIDAYVGLGADRAQLEALVAEVVRRSRSSAGGANRTRRAPQEVDETTRGHDVRAHYQVRRYDVEFVFDGSGSIRSVHSTVDIAAKSQGVCFYYSGHSVDEAHRSRAPQITVLSGAKLERINMSPLGAFDMFMRLDEPLDPGRAVHTLSYIVELEDDALADPAILYHAPPGARRHSLTAVFNAPTTPERLWWFAGPDSLQAEHPGPGSELVPGADGSYRYTFDPLVGGWVYGFTWLWPVELDCPPNMGSNRDIR